MLIIWKCSHSYTYRHTCRHPTCDCIGENSPPAFHITELKEFSFVSIETGYQHFLSSPSDLRSLRFFSAEKMSKLTQKEEQIKILAQLNSRKEILFIHVFSSMIFLLVGEIFRISILKTLSKQRNYLDIKLIKYSKTLQKSLEKYYFQCKILKFSFVTSTSMFRLPLSI